MLVGRSRLCLLTLAATLAVALFATSCRNTQTFSSKYEGVSETHIPANSLHSEELQDYVLAYCLRTSEQGNAEARRTDIIVSRGDGSQSSTITSPRSPRFGPVNLGCFGHDDFFFTGAYSLAWRPGSSQLTMAVGVADSPDSFYFVDFRNGSTAHLPGRTIEGTNKYLYSPLYELAWSSTGEWLATRALGVNVPGLDNIWLYNPDTDQIRKLIDRAKFREPIGQISWSPSGHYLAVSYSFGLAGIGIVRLDDLSYSSINNENQTLLRNWSQDVSHPHFRLRSELDGSSQPVWIDQDQSVIFTAPAADGSVTLFAVDADGTNVRELLPGLPGLVNLPTLAGDGRQLAFVRFPEWAEVPDRAEIVVADLETKEIRSLTVLPAPSNDTMLYISGLDWTPDGKYLAFSSNHGGQADIYVISADGQAWMNLTDEIDGDAVNPLWRP